MAIVKLYLGYSFHGFEISTRPKRSGYLNAWFDVTKLSGIDYSDWRTNVYRLYFAPPGYLTPALAKEINAFIRATSSTAAKVLLRDLRETLRENSK